MKNLKLPIFCITILLFTSEAFAQSVGIGSAVFTPSADVILELRSTNKGFLTPRMTQAQKNAISSPTDGLLIYQTDGSVGFYYYSASAWRPFMGVDDLGNHLALQDIVLDDNQIVNVAGGDGISIDNNGNVGIGAGAVTPDAKLEVSGGDLKVSASGGAANSVKFQNPAGTFSTNIKAGAQTQDIVYTWPVVPPTAGYVLASGSAGDLSWVLSEAAAIGWNLLGNAVSATHFLGTTNVQPLRIKVNNTQSGLITQGGATTYGFQSGLVNTATSITALGYRAMAANTSGMDNTAVGYQSMEANTTGSDNTAIGTFSLKANTTGNRNTALGEHTMEKITTGSDNTSAGRFAMKSVTTGNSNTSFGKESMESLTTGSGNTAMGINSGSSLTTGSNNTFIGANTVGGAALTNATAIGYGATVTTSNSLVLGELVNVGIGTSAPGSKLDVVGSVRFQSLSGTGDRAVVTDASGVLSAQALGWEAIGNAGTTAPTSAIGVAVNNNFIGTTDLKDLVIASNARERVRISSGGNVGIATLLPAATLDVNGSFSTARNNVACSNGVNDNLNVGDFSFIKITGPTAVFNISGITGGVDGRIVTIYNSVAFNMTITNEGVSSLAANRITTLTGADISTTGVGSVTLQYDSVASRWIVIAVQQ